MPRTHLAELIHFSTPTIHKVWLPSRHGECLRRRRAPRSCTKCQRCIIPPLFVGVPPPVHAYPRERMCERTRKGGGTCFIGERDSIRFIVAIGRAAERGANPLQRRQKIHTRCGTMAHALRRGRVWKHRREHNTSYTLRGRFCDRIRYRKIVLVGDRHVECLKRRARREHEDEARLCNQWLAACLTEIRHWLTQASAFPSSSILMG